MQQLTESQLLILWAVLTFWPWLIVAIVWGILYIKQNRIKSRVDVRDVIDKPEYRRWWGIIFDGCNVLSNIVDYIYDMVTVDDLTVQICYTFYFTLYYAFNGGIFAYLTRDLAKHGIDLQTSYGGAAVAVLSSPYSYFRYKRSQRANTKPPYKRWYFHQRKLKLKFKWLFMILFMIMNAIKIYQIPYQQYYITLTIIASVIKLIIESIYDEHVITSNKFWHKNGSKKEQELILIKQIMTLPNNYDDNTVYLANRNRFTKTAWEMHLSNSYQNRLWYVETWSQLQEYAANEYRLLSQIYISIKNEHDGYLEHKPVYEQLKHALTADVPDIRELQTRIYGDNGTSFEYSVLKISKSDTTGGDNQDNTLGDNREIEQNSKSICKDKEKLHSSPTSHPSAKKEDIVVTELQMSKINNNEIGNESKNNEENTDVTSNLNDEIKSDNNNSNNDNDNNISPGKEIDQPLISSTANHNQNTYTRVGSNLKLPSIGKKLRQVSKQDENLCALFLSNSNNNIGSHSDRNGSGSAGRSLPNGTFENDCEHEDEEKQSTLILDVSPTKQDIDVGELEMSKINNIETGNAINNNDENTGGILNDEIKDNDVDNINNININMNGDDSGHRCRRSSPGSHDKAKEIEKQLVAERKKQSEDNINAWKKTEDKVKIVSDLLFLFVLSSVCCGQWLVLYLWFLSTSRCFTSAEWSAIRNFSVVATNVLKTPKNATQNLKLTKPGRDVNSVEEWNAIQKRERGKLETEEELKTTEYPVDKKVVAKLKSQSQPKSKSNSNRNRTVNDEHRQQHANASKSNSRLHSNSYRDDNNDNNRIDWKNKKHLESFKDSMQMNNSTPMYPSRNHKIIDPSNATNYRLPNSLRNAATSPLPNETGDRSSKYDKNKQSNNNKQVCDTNGNISQSVPPFAPQSPDGASVKSGSSASSVLSGFASKNIDDSLSSQKGVSVNNDMHDIDTDDQRKSRKSTTIHFEENVQSQSQQSADALTNDSASKVGSTKANEDGGERKKKLQKTKKNAFSVKTNNINASKHAPKDSKLSIQSNMSNASKISHQSSSSSTSNDCSGSRSSSSTSDSASSRSSSIDDCGKPTTAKRKLVKVRLKQGSIGSLSEMSTDENVSTLTGIGNIDEPDIGTVVVGGNNDNNTGTNTNTNDEVADNDSEGSHDFDVANVENGNANVNPNGDENERANNIIKLQHGGSNSPNSNSFRNYNQMIEESKEVKINENVNEMELKNSSNNKCSINKPNGALTQAMKFNNSGTTNVNEKKAMVNDKNHDNDNNIQANGKAQTNIDNNSTKHECSGA